MVLVVSILTIEFDSTVSVAQGVLGHTAICPKVLDVDVIYGQAHCYFVAGIKGFRNKALT